LVLAVIPAGGSRPGIFPPDGNEVTIMRFGRYESSDGNNAGTAVTFFLIGLGAGALAALALAPKTGKQFRRDLKRGYNDAKDTLQDWGEEAKDRVRDAKERVRDVAERGVEMAEDLRDSAREKAEPLRRVINRS
jgi:gas vesicle protein